MKLRVLGIHNMESRDTRLAGYLVDDVLALDAGSISRSLSFAEQGRIETLLLTHEHNDHVRDLPALRHNLSAAGRTLSVLALPETLSAINARYLPAGGDDAVRPREVRAGERISVGRHSVRAVRMPHGVPCAGYWVSDGTASLFYTGDTGPGLGAVWRQVAPDALLTEVTYGNDNLAEARRLGHLTPRLLGEELAGFASLHGYLPRVIVTHMSPPWEDAVRREIECLSAALDADVAVAAAGETLQVRPVPRPRAGRMPREGGRPA